jgi:hypothetical protein
MIYNSIYLRNSMRSAKSFTIDAEVSDYVAATKGDSSASERVNQLLKRAILQEQFEKLAVEAAAFYTVAAPHRTEEIAFQKASSRTLNRD